MAIGQSNYPTALDAATDLVEATNDASTTLTSAITNSAMQLQVASTAAFPSTGIVEIGTELIAYSSKGVGVLNVASGGRGYEGTIAAAASSGAAVDLVISAASNNVKNAAIIALETKLGTGSSTPVNRAVLRGGSTAGTSSYEQLEYDIGAHAEFAPVANQVMLRFRAPRAFTVPATGYQGGVATNPSANRDFTIQKNGSTFATVRFSSAGVFSVVSATVTDFAIGDELRVTAPSTADTAMTGIAITIPGTIKG